MTRDDPQARSVTVLLALGGTSTGIRSKGYALLVAIRDMDVWVTQTGALEPDVDGLLDA